MVQLGTLAAGVAHELNNPAAAVQRTAGQLSAELDRLIGALPDHGRATEALELLGARDQQARTPVEVSDEEEAVEDWLRCGSTRHGSGAAGGPASGSPNSLFRTAPI